MPYTRQVNMTITIEYHVQLSASRDTMLATSRRSHQFSKGVMRCGALLDLHDLDISRVRRERVMKPVGLSIDTW